MSWHGEDGGIATLVRRQGDLLSSLQRRVQLLPAQQRSMVIEEVGRSMALGPSGGNTDGGTAPPTADWSKEVPNIVRDFGASLDPTKDDTQPWADAYEQLPPGSPLVVPHAGISAVDPLGFEKQLQLWGAGSDSFWFQSRQTHTGPLITVDIPLPPPIPGTIRGFYGTGLRDFGINIGPGGEHASGLELGVNTHWCDVERVRVYGPAGPQDGDAFRNLGFNNHFDTIRAFDTGRYMFFDGDTGLEAAVINAVFGRNSPGETTATIEVVCQDATAIKGGLWLENIRSASGTGAAFTSGGVKVSAPAFLSVPIFGVNVTLDNITGDGLVLENVRDLIWALGWINTAAGGACVKITGGGNLRFLGNDYRGGGSPAKTYWFTGTGDPVDGFVSIGNYVPTNWAYYLGGLAFPLKCQVQDLVFSTAPLAISNNMAAWMLAQGPQLGTRWFGDETRIEPEPHRFVGLTGQPAFQNGFANADTDRRTYFWRDALFAVHLAGIVTSGLGPTNPVTVFTLPTGYRPLDVEHFTGVTNDGQVRVIEVTPDGTVRVYGAVAGDHISLSGVAFRWGGG